MFGLPDIHLHAFLAPATLPLGKSYRFPYSRRLSGPRAELNVVLNREVPASVGNRIPLFQLVDSRYID
jgi:hypothetical protein